jgi:hypothetical protein
MFKRSSAATGSISMEVDNEPEHLYRDVGVRGIQDRQETECTTRLLIDRDELLML